MRSHPLHRMHFNDFCNLFQVESLQILTKQFSNTVSCFNYILSLNTSTNFTVKTKLLF